MTEFIITCQSELDEFGAYKVERYRELIRCKNCKNAEILPWLDNAIICKKHSYTGVRPDEFYCADGVKRDD